MQTLMSTSPQSLFHPRKACSEAMPMWQLIWRESMAFECTACDQMWHNSCDNLKGNLAKSTVDQLDHWQCPWCFTCPFEPPKKHKSVSTAKVITETVFSDAVITQIEESIKSSLAVQSTVELLNSICSDLDKLSQGVNAFAQNLQPHAQEEQGTDLNVQGCDGSIFSIKQDIAPPRCDAFSVYKDNFVSDEQAAGFVAFFDEEEFKIEGSRKVAIGERYHYKGSTGSERPIPEAVIPLIDKIKKDMSLQYDLNQVLVNKYENSSTLPPHSDDEGSIKPDSSIFTVSLGSSGKIEFSHISSGDKQELAVEPNSLYSMTRQSQKKYKHHVLPNNSLDQL